MTSAAKVLTALAVLVAAPAVAGVPVDGPPQTPLPQGLVEPSPTLSVLQPLEIVGPPAGFLETEERLQAVIAISNASATGDLTLARFYAANGLEAEALQTFARVEDSMLSCADAVMTAKLRFALGRYRAITATGQTRSCDNAGDRDMLAAYAGAAWTKLGAYQQAIEAISAISPLSQNAPSEGISTAIIEARIFASDEDDAVLRAEINLLHRSADRQLLLMLLAFREGDLRAARSHAKALEKRRHTDEAQVRASVMLARIDLVENNQAPDEIVERLQRLSLKWQGGAGERDLRSAELDAAAQAGDIAGALAAGRNLIMHAPESNLAERVADRAGTLLPRLFEPATTGAAMLPPQQAAAVFFDYVEFAPPGARGDALIRSVAHDLAALGLYSEAQKLLAHQVFKRLRGPERAAQAALLASFYLEDSKPADALLTLRRTRMAGLAVAVNAERLRLEIAALTKLGDEDAALAALERDEALEGASALRADILWRMKKWAAAKDAYIDAATSAAGPARDALVLRAATSAILADDDNAYQRIVADYSDALTDARVRELVDALGGDISSPAFLEAYRTAFDTSANGI